MTVEPGSAPELDLYADSASAEDGGTERQPTRAAQPESVTAQPEPLPQIDVYRPTDGSRLGSVPVQSGTEVRAAVERVRAVQRGWGTLAPQDRARRMEPLLTVMRDRAEEIADVIQAETGKPRGEALAEVAVCLDLIRYYRRNASRILRTRRVPTAWMFWKSGRFTWEPFGVVGVIAPWNYPLILSLDPTVTALFAGNGVVLKPSEYTPFTGLFVAELCRDAGLPEGLVEVVTGDGPTGAALVESGVDKVHFTGSTATGRRVMGMAARSLTPVTMELGGKDPAIVLEDADLERAARGIVFGGFYNAGQTCVSTERVYVVETVFEPFVRRVVELTRQLRTGAGPGADRDVGPMAHEAQAGIVETHIRDAVARGARVVIGGERSDPTSPFIEPTVLVDIAPGSKVLEEETFGPVLAIVRVRDEQEAIDRANEGSYGLYASVWTRRTERGRRVAGRLRAGGVSVNDTLSHYAMPALPLGGVGDSGFGRTRGEEGLLQMSRSRSLFVDRLGLRKELWWYPYSDFDLRVFRSLIAWRGTLGPAGLWRAVRTFLKRGGGDDDGSASPDRGGAHRRDPAHPPDGEGR
jgi:succinate-semialdehyde dehydrogenase/glutarate-semialdehyde dehydrogenase